jgi:hypothetical protein
MTLNPIELTVLPHPDDDRLYRAVWGDGESALSHIPECWLDLFGFLLARRLLEWGYNPERELIVYLAGADYLLMQAPLGAAAATPLVNYAQPVQGPAHALRVPP